MGCWPLWIPFLQRNNIVKRDLLTLADVTPDEIRQMLTLALELKQRQKHGESTSLLVGKSLVLLFSKPSLRTRASFEVGMHQLGGHTSYFEDPGIVMGLREPFNDLGRVLSRYYDAIAIRTFAHESVVELDGMLPETRECHGSMVPLRAARAEAALTCLDRNMCDEAHSGRDADFRRARGASATHHPRLAARGRTVRRRPRGANGPQPTGGFEASASAP